MKGLYAVYALITELLMLAALATCALAAFDGAVGMALAVGAVVVVGVFWGTFLSPRAARPLAPAASMAAKAVLFVGTGLLVVLAGFGIFGVLLAVAGLGLVALEARVGPAASHLGGSPQR